MVPKLRFPEFQDAMGWKEISLQKLARPVTDRATTGDADNILSLSGDHGLVLQSDYFGKKIAGDSTDRYLKIRKDDFVYNDRTTKASSFGTIKRLSNHASGIVSPIYKCFRFQTSENPAFWEWYFESGSHDPALGGLINEGARAGRFNISVTQFLSTYAWRPEELEQQKIADCLDSTDALIAAQGRKVEALMAHKKGLMQQLFPQERETQPRLRFPEFVSAGDWEERAFSELCDIKHGYAFESEFFSNEGDYVLLTPGNFYEEGGYRDRGEKQKYFIGEIPRAYVLTAGDMLVAMTEQAAGLLGSPILVPDSDKFLHNQRLGLVTPKPGSAWLNEFFFYVLNTMPVRKSIHDTASGAKVRHTSPTKIGDVVVSVPTTINEQQRIAECLTSLDDLIAAQTQKLDNLKTHKNGLMQQLFPSVGEDDA
ncbi:type I restriction enzyme S subunit [Sphingomonas leidyi]|uniref:Type I restriction enzyme S subunit n=1 Tax=Sphingomonas leidyi TaxID=68569 RepID=A0A7X5UXN0_9SPHN|nr:restriction endonuclease subunit S [Sphingomonas leidyi]NIJ64102.1 type I restriction enzyme S subunit [Sphingomonas leidyi]